MIDRILVATTLVSLVAAPVAAATAQTELQPSSKWNVDYGRERCTLMREFGSDGSAVHLQIDSFGAWNRFRVLLTGPAIPRLHDPTGTAAVSLMNEMKAGVLPTLQGSAGEFGAVSFDLAFMPYLPHDVYMRLSDDEKTKWLMKTSRPQPEYEAAVDRISVRPGSGNTIVLHVGSMGKPLAAMRACIDDLYKSWGLDPAQQMTLTREPVPKKSTLDRVRADYPLAQRFGGVSAYVPVRVLVDAHGSATSCVVQTEGIDEAFKTAVCNHLQGSFDPALDADGKPVMSVFHTSVFYKANS